MLVAFATAQRKVDDWPRSIVAGSAVERVDAGRLGLRRRRRRSLDTGAGGGGGATATFFLHPAVASKSVAANTAALSVLLFIRILNVLMPSMNFDYNRLRSYSIPLAHTGWRLLPCVVSCRTLVPSASIE